MIYSINTLMTFDCFICLGSNYNQNRYIKLAQKQLIELFPTICFAKEEITEPLLVNKKEKFINQVARFQTEMNEIDTKNELKKIEILCGQTSIDKLHEIIRMDIDLLIYNNRILKPNDLKRDYIQRGIEELI